MYVGPSQLLASSKGGNAHLAFENGFKSTGFPVMCSRPRLKQKCLGAVRRNQTHSGAIG